MLDVSVSCFVALVSSPFTFYTDDALCIYFIKKGHARPSIERAIRRDVIETCWSAEQTREKVASSLCSHGRNLGMWLEGILR
jgi:hypothetical protein